MMKLPVIRPVGAFLPTKKETFKIKQCTLNCKNGAYLIIREWLHFVQVIAFNPETNSYSNTNIAKSRWPSFVENLAATI